MPVQNNYFNHILVHELNAPLNALEGYLRLIRQNQETNNQSDSNILIQRCETRINEMKQLVSNLLDFSFANQHLGEITEFNLYGIVEESVETIKSIIDQKKLQIFIHPNKKVNLNANITDFVIIFNNVISNAAKFNCLKGKIDIRFQVIDNELIVNVADTGIGMLVDEMEFVFDEFVRIKNQDTKAISGSGLGLSIVKRIVTLYNGKISLQSAKNKGTTVNIAIPWPVKKEK